MSHPSTVPTTVGTLPGSPPDCTRPCTRTEPTPPRARRAETRRWGDMPRPRWGAMLVALALIRQSPGSFRKNG